MKKLIPIHLAKLPAEVVHLVGQGWAQVEIKPMSVSKRPVRSYSEPKKNQATVMLTEGVRVEMRAWLLQQGYRHGNGPSLSKFIQAVQRGEWMPKRGRRDMLETGKGQFPMSMYPDELAFMRPTVELNYGNWSKFCHDVMTRWMPTAQMAMETGVELCSFGGDCDLCKAPVGRTWVAMSHGPDGSEADYYVGECCLARKHAEIQAEIARVDEEIDAMTPEDWASPAFLAAQSGDGNRNARIRGGECGLCKILATKKGKP